jgi:hypothetical protein
MANRFTDSLDEKLSWDEHIETIYKVGAGVGR